MSAQERLLLEQAAMSRAPPPRKPTSQGYPLTLCKCLGAAAASCAGLSIGFGSFPQGGENTPFMAYVMPVVAGIVAALGLGIGWHIDFEVAAHATELHRKILAAVAAIFLFGAGCATSALTLATFLGGGLAVQAYEHHNLNLLKRSGEPVITNAGGDAPLLAAVEGASNTLRSAAASEDKTGVVAKGKTGKGVAYRGLSDAADNMARIATAMRQHKQDRDERIAAAQSAITEAENSAASGERASFEQAFARARDALMAADKIKLSSDAAALNIGLALDRSAQSHVSYTVQEIEIVRQRADTGRQAVTLPTFKAISDQDAVKIMPPAFAWTAAIMIEMLPLVALGMLLLLWRAEEWPIPYYAPLRSTPQPAE